MILAVVSVIIVFLAVFLLIGKNSDNNPSYTDNGSSQESDSTATMPTDSPIPTPIPTDNIIEESPAYDDSEYSYRNDRVLQCRLYNGGVLSVGVDDSAYTDSLYLEPNVFDADNDDIAKYAVYITSYNSNITILGSEPGDANTDVNAEYTTFVVTDRTYDTLVPSAHGVNWNYNPLRSGVYDEGNPPILYYRVVRLSDNICMGVAALKIAYDTTANEFYLDTLYDCDVSNTGELDADTRAELVQRALDFIVNPTVGPNLSNNQEGYWATALQRTVVQKTSHFYFGELLNPQQSTIHAGQYNGCDIYAVNVPFPTLGFCTVYFLPQAQILGFSSPTINGNTELDLQIVGYDYLFPFSKDYLQAPDY